MGRLLLQFAVVGAVLSELSVMALGSLGWEDLPPVGSAGGPSRVLSWPEARQWLSGRALFRHAFEDKDGLGAPGFNAPSCGTCHVEPALGGAGGPEFDVLSFQGISHYDPGKEPGNQLAKMRELRDKFAARGRSLAGFDVRQTPSLLGLGLIDEIPDEEILRNEDPRDVDGDGVRGVASRISVNGATEIGRFGWKAEVPRLSDFVCRALGGELGLTAPDQGRGFGLAADTDRAEDPETSQEALDDLDFFVALLAAPRRVEAADGQVLRGEQLFERTGCAVCHVPALYGSDGRVELYSDLLLHELQAQPEEDESVSVRVAIFHRGHEEEDEASRVAARQFRTAPLWGIGKTAPYLHDGSAKTLADAVLAHAAEGTVARDRYAALAAEDQQALLAFLSSL